MKIQESGENYLETILILREKMAGVRSIDIATELGYSKPSISRAVKVLRGDNYITVDKNGFIELTEKGEALAQRIYERHRLLTAYLTAIGVDEKTAAADACRIEHVISEETFSKLKAHAAQGQKAADS